MTEESFNRDNLNDYCDLLAAKDPRIGRIIETFGYPPFWTRAPSYDGLVRIILEQQVSLASAYACFRKLQETVSAITPEKILPLQDKELKGCGISRQKITYLKSLAHEIQSGELDLKALNRDTSANIRKRLIAIKGIGNWTIDVYLLSALHRLDILPIGDLVLIKALKRSEIVLEDDPTDQIIKKCDKFRPYRSILCNILWHRYIVEKNIDPTLMD